jgi:hypothetical protein
MDELIKWHDQSFFQQIKEKDKRNFLQIGPLRIEKSAYSMMWEDAHNLKVKIAQIELEKYTITSPISGVIKNLPNQRNVVNINAPKVLMIIE